MTDTKELDRKARRLAQVESFKRRIGEVGGELAAYRAALSDKLDQLRSINEADEEQVFAVTFDGDGCDADAARAATRRPSEVGRSGSCTASSAGCPRA